MRILYTSADLHEAIKAILDSPAIGERRVVVVAYVGRKAEAFLPHPQGLEIVCALEPGATSAEAIVRLRERGAKVWQAERLHMKVYWSSRRGAVVCSANASAGALGRSGLKEAGVWLPKEALAFGSFSGTHDLGLSSTLIFALSHVRQTAWEHGALRDAPLAKASRHR